MTEVIIEQETPPEESGDSAEEIAEAIVEAQEEAQEEAEQEAAVEQAQEASEMALQAVSLHDHPEYSPIGHSHPEYDHSERIALLESRVELIEHGMEESETTEVEEVEQTPAETTEPERKPRGFRRGRR
jgi:hypothetical protein